MGRKKIYRFLFVVFFLLSVNLLNSQSESFVELTSSNGRVISVKILRKDTQSVWVVKKSGDEFKINLKTLSEESNAYVGSWTSPHERASEYLDTIILCSLERVGSVISSASYNRIYYSELDPGSDNCWTSRPSRDERERAKEKMISEYTRNMDSYASKLHNPKSGMDIYSLSFLDLIRLMYEEKEMDEFPLRVIYGNLKYPASGRFTPPFGEDQPISLLVKKAEIYKNLSEILPSDEFEEFDVFFDKIIAIYTELDSRIKKMDSPRLYIRSSLRSMSYPIYQSLVKPD